MALIEVSLQFNVQGNQSKALAIKINVALLLKKAFQCALQWQERRLK
jgi:hypothetical protein